MGLLVVGSIALDSVATPFGETADAPGGSAGVFSAAGAILHPLPIGGGGGRGYPLRALKTREARGRRLPGVGQAPGGAGPRQATDAYGPAGPQRLQTRPRR